jgi:hypothetical protein
MLQILGDAGTALLALLGVVIPFSPKSARLSESSAAAPVRKWLSCMPRSLPQCAGAGKEARPDRALQPIAVPAGPLSPTQHFERVGAVVATAIRSARLAAEIQEAARIQLEVVELSIDRILDEVAEVMALTPELSALRRIAPAAVPALRLAA